MRPSRSTRILIPVLVLSAALAVRATQSATMPAADSGLIIGRVVEASSGSPIPRTIVTLTGSGVSARRVVVDRQGRFMFRDLPAGAFTLTATRTGYLEGAYGKQRPDGTGYPLDLRAEERVTDATVKMWRFATISGTVTDDAGDPVPGSGIQVLKRTVFAGHWRLVHTGIGANSDERGMYRVIGLVPGEYALVITSLTGSIPASFMVAVSASRTLDPQAAADFNRDLQAKGSGGFASDLIQGFPVVRVGDMLLQTGSAPTVPDGRSVNVYPTVWYPAGATRAEAALVTLGAGDSLTNIDLHPTLTATMRVSGSVTGSNGPVAYLALRLLPAGLDDVDAEVTSSLSRSFNVASTISDASGAFTFMAVPPGQYVIRALTSPPPPALDPVPAPTVLQTADGMSAAIPSRTLPPLVTKETPLWVAAPVSVGDTDVSGVSVTLQSALRLTGRVEFDGTAVKPTAAELRSVRVSMEPADGRTVALPPAYRGQIDQSGAFYTIGLIPGRYVLRIDGPPKNWILKSAIVGGRDVADVPLTLDSTDVDGVVVTFTDRPSSLSGTVRTEQGSADGNAAVLIFPSDGGWTDLGTSPRRLRNARPSRTGAFNISGLPPGEYRVIAIDDQLAGNWQAPASLQKLAPAATRVTIIEGQTATLNLTTMVVR